MCVKKGQSWDRAILQMDRGLALTLDINYWNQPHTCYSQPVNPVFTELYAKPLRAPTLVCLPCCAFFGLQ